MDWWSYGSWWGDCTVTPWMFVVESQLSVFSSEWRKRRRRRWPYCGRMIADSQLWCLRSLPQSWRRRRSCRRQGPPFRGENPAECRRCQSPSWARYSHCTSTLRTSPCPAASSPAAQWSWSVGRSEILGEMKFRKYLCDLSRQSQISPDKVRDQVWGVADAGSLMP